MPNRALPGKLIDLFQLWLDDIIHPEKQGSNGFAEKQESRKPELDANSSLNKMGDNVWEHDFTTGKTFFSENIQRLLGYDIMHHPDKESFWWSIVHIADKPILEKNDRAYKSGELSSHSVEYRVRHRTGEIKWIHDRGVVIEKSVSGKPLRIVGTHTDITDRKMSELKLLESERRFRDLAGNVPGVVYQWVENILGMPAFTYVSPRMKEYFGIEPEEMHLLIDRVHPEDKAAWEASVTIAKQTGNPWTFEGRLLYPDGSIKWFRGQSVLSEKDERGMVYNGIMIDTTTEMELRQALAQKEKDSRRQVLKATIDGQEKERDAISYELHENVNQVLATTKLLMDLIKPVDEKTNDYINQGKANLESVMTELRNISHGLNSSMLNYVGLEGAITDLLAHINSTKVVQFTADIDPQLKNNNLNKAVELTIFRIVQAQASNIVRHSKASRANVSITRHTNEVVIEIKDNGKGFDKAAQTQGLGLLNIAHRAELFNGTAEILTAPGSGFHLVVRIPVTIN